MSLEAPAVLSHLSSWLTCFELCAMRAVSRNFYAGIPRHTWELTASSISSSRPMDHLSRVFPHVWCLRLQDAILEEMSAMETLVPWLHKDWKLRELVLTRVTCISGFYVHIQAQELTKITIRQCYQVQEPAIVAPNLETLVIQHCPMVKFRSETSLPQLKNLLLSSRSFTASHARYLIKDTLPKSPALNSLSLSGCSQLEQVLGKKVLEERGLLKRGPPASHDDPLLLRYLRARRWVVEDAYQQFKDTEEWRKANDLDVLYNTIDLDAYEQSRRLYPQWTGRRDRRGIPVYVFEVKTLDNKTVHEYEKVGASTTFSQAKADGKTPSGLLRLFALYENLTRFNMPFCTQLHDREHPEVPITLSTNIVDISGVGLKQFWNLKQHMQAASQLATAHYPETLDRIFIIGAPVFFSTVWGWIKRWFDPITVSKIFILGSHEVKSVLEQYIEPRNIPKKYGGELDYTFGQLSIPDPHWDGIVKWENGYKGFPSGPLLWEDIEGDRLACVARGYKGGQPRNERVCTIPKTFSIAPVEAKTNGVNGVSTGTDAHDHDIAEGTQTTRVETHDDGVQTDDALMNDVQEKLKIQDDKPAAAQTTTA